jgi:16S rRNA (guanine527-N7)-methyltransferase
VDLVSILAPYITGLSPTQLAQVSTYLDLLLRWNAKMNLTSIRDPEKVVSRHFGESFFLASHLFGPNGPFHLPTYQLTNLLICDLGSGAGFPAIPLKIYRPDVTITLVEAQHRKAVFLREVLRALSLDAEVKNVRAEDLPPASADLVTFRAVEKFDSILPTAARLIRPISVHSPLSTVHGLALLIGFAQIPVAKKMLPTWHFHPEIPIPNSQNRVIQLLEPR